MILVTGATGNNGRELIKRLSAAGAAVRGMVRNPLATDKLIGVEFVAGDFDDPESSRRALEGISHSFTPQKFASSLPALPCHRGGSNPCFRYGVHQPASQSLYAGLARVPVLIMSQSGSGNCRDVSNVYNTEPLITDGREEASLPDGLASGQGCHRYLTSFVLGIRAGL